MYSIYETNIKLNLEYIQISNGINTSNQIR